MIDCLISKFQNKEHIVRNPLRVNDQANKNNFPEQKIIYYSY